eukprot:scaffold931_cov383-Prasinococcus_capsulatus_cf.AAC.21
MYITIRSWLHWKGGQPKQHSHGASRAATQHQGRSPAGKTHSCGTASPHREAPRPAERSVLHEPDPAPRRRSRWASGRFPGKATWPALGAPAAPRGLRGPRRPAQHAPFLNTSAAPAALPPRAASAPRISRPSVHPPPGPPHLSPREKPAPSGEMGAGRGVVSV